MHERIVLLTDGHGGDPTVLASCLKQSGVVIDVIGIGGSREEVAEPILREVASVVNDELRYAFIEDVDALLRRAEKISKRIVK